MKRILPIVLIGCAVTAIIALGFGASLFRWEAFIWPASVIVLSLSLLMQQDANDRNCTTIDFQSRIIRSQGELLARIVTEENDGRE